MTMNWLERTGRGTEEAVFAGQKLVVVGGSSGGLRKYPLGTAPVASAQMDGWTPGEAAEEEPDGHGDQRGCSRSLPSADGPAARGGAGTAGRGTTRRRASDAFRLGLAVVVVAVSIPVMRANSAAELSIVRAVHPPPAAISWLAVVC